MSTTDPLLPAEVDEVPNQPSISEHHEVRHHQQGEESANAGGHHDEDESASESDDTRESHDHNLNQEPTAILTSPNAVLPLPATAVISHPPQAMHYDHTQAFASTYAAGPPHGPSDNDDVMKDAGTGLPSMDPNAAANLKHGEDGSDHHHHHTSEQEMQDIEQAVMAEVPLPGDPDMTPPPAKKRRTGSKRSSVRPWNDMLYQLLMYRMAHGHVMVPFKTGGELGKWVSQQRTQFANLQKTMREKPQGLNSSEALTDERMRVLTSIGFVWDVVQADNDARWKKRYDELMHYKNEHGHCNVPQSTDLGKWVKMQRENKHESDLKKTGATPHRKKPKPCLSEDRIAKLEAIGFQWRVAKPAVGWDKRYQQLVDYKKIHGDCNVPQSYPPDKPFGRWVMKQRCQHSLKLRGEKSQLTDEREDKLNSIGFSWVAPGFSKKTVTMPGDEEEVSELHAAQAATHPVPDEQELYNQHAGIHHNSHFTWTV